MFRSKFIVAILVWVQSAAFGQFQDNGSAHYVSDNCFAFYTLSEFKAGTIWSVENIDLIDSLDANVQFYLGCPEDEHNKGFVFVFQALGTFVGNYSSNTGYEGISPSLAIEVDIQQDADNNDPEFDHLAIVSNGVLDHDAAENIAGPVPIIEGETSIQDCQTHDLRVLWVPSLSRLDIYIDCQLRLSQVINFSAHFGEFINMYWGVTSGNYLDINDVEICFQGEQQIDEVADVSLCAGGEIRLQAPFSGLTYSWRPAAGLSATNIPNPVAKPDTTTTYTLLMVNECGQKYREEITVNVVDNTAQFDLGPADTVVCHGENLLLDATFENAIYHWEDGTNQPLRSINQSGEYAITVTTPECQITDEMEIFFTGPPSLKWPTDTLVCLEESFQLTAEIPGGVYLWEDGSTAPQVEVNTPGNYAVTVSNLCGTAQAESQVDLLECQNFYIPNAFSPNEDGVNDTFFIQGGDNGASIQFFRVFDRWGVLVYEAIGISANDPMQGWDGKFNSKLMLPGTYVYMLEAILLNGSSYIQSGEVNLLR